MSILPERMTVAADRDLVVFLIGARANRWWHLPVVLGTARAMGRMLRELSHDPQSGLLGFESFVGRTIYFVQYWRSAEDLYRYAHRRDKAHVPAWRKWAQSWAKTRAMGIWHETYVVPRGNYECIYHHMPPFGLGRVGELVPATGALHTAAGRMAQGKSTEAATT
ncbi:MAG: DUF4188 domain-containing protein [Myxococcales bacterium FL481]|nr:MAG: DUF4188 domain-containing protein [Myxococcales bacterium FL481]